MSSTPHQTRPEAPTPTQRVPVQDWTTLTEAPPYNVSASVMDTALNHVVLPQDMAQAVYNTMNVLLLFNPEIADKFNKSMFSR
ncbi:hypothetical protein SNOG_05543 [Parastagonospora nodorum SN15]|uniref:Uncharacterized protein n=1 Tax=Phaeosphaeria nodorum (strain SN15 / ATCC MYA-4574 / FGSC 10173) TaxID=321614 RepID=Q0URS1_PHANO|nr:hypothetical protein SNOG_05543 [Parastagonospora nodorum SN15]EAT86607.2 hypothetical protein SNOG_05543 [Parastagonospora nodorum SN15]KAH4476784.1 hypothetical protein HBH89_253600 [Parastagonospora nodorum]